MRIIKGSDNLRVPNIHATPDRNAKESQRTATINFSSEDDSDSNNAAKRAKLSTSVNQTADRQQCVTSTPTSEQGNEATKSVDSNRDSAADTSIEKESYALKASRPL